MASSHGNPPMPTPEGSSQVGESSSKAAQSKPPPTSNGAPKPSKPENESQLSPAEQKKLKKAEAKARREKQVRERQAGGAGPSTGAPPHGQPGNKRGTEKSQSQEGAGKGSQANFKESHKRTESSHADAHRALPIRGAVRRGGSALLVGQKDPKEVALFGHLYGQPRRMSLVGAARDIHPAVLALGLQMSSYVICGSNARCVATLFCFKRVIESYNTPPGTTLTRHLTSHLSPQIDYLRSCRPLSISMGNAIRWLKLEISKVDIDTPESDAKTELCEAIDNFIRERITVADQVIATSASEKIRDGDVILTFAKSSIVQQTLVRAFERGTRFRVLVVDSKPLFEGKSLARSLARQGLEVQYCLMQAIGHVVKDASKVLLGAHAMMSNGRLFSRVGTALVAMMAHEADLPVIVCCESLKFTERVALDSVVNNEVAPPEELISPSPSSSFSSSSSSSTTPARSSGQRQASATGSGTEVAASTAPAPAANATVSPAEETKNQQLLNIMYDVTPAEYIKMVVTEFGSLPPSSVPVVHRLSTNQ